MDSEGFICCAWGLMCWFVKIKLFNAVNLLGKPRQGQNWLPPAPAGLWHDPQSLSWCLCPAEQSRASVHVEWGQFYGEWALRMRGQWPGGPGLPSGRERKLGFAAWQTWECLQFLLRGLVFASLEWDSNLLVHKCFRLHEIKAGPFLMWLVVHLKQPSICAFSVLREAVICGVMT